MYVKLAIFNSRFWEEEYMVKVGVIACAILLVVSSMGCYGPQQLTRGLDDWSNQMYVDSPWLSQVLYYVGVYSIGFILTGIADGLVLNPIDFWGTSAFKGEGTAYKHVNPTPKTPAKK